MSAPAPTPEGRRIVETLNRAHHADLEIRGDGRTVVGIAVPFDTPTAIRDMEGVYDETFRRGAFAKTIAERGNRVKFLAQHDRRSMPLGKASLLREDAAGLYAEFRVSKTTAGDEALELIRDGALDALSVGFRPIKSRANADRSAVERLEVGLDEVSAVSFPAYDGALIAGVRAGAYGEQARELLAALAADPDLALEFARALPLGSPAVEAALDEGTPVVEPVEPMQEPRSTPRMSPEARVRALALLTLGDNP
jgi:HK97 family phage prohead protease